MLVQLASFKCSALCFADGYECAKGRAQRTGRGPCGASTQSTLQSLVKQAGCPPQVITQSVAPCLAGAKGSAAASTPNTLSTIHFDPYASSALRERARGSEPRSPLKVSSLRELGLAPTIKRRFFQDLCLGAPRAALRPTPARAKGPAQAKAKKTKEAKFKKSPRCARLREVLIPAPRGGQCV